MAITRQFRDIRPLTRAPGLRLFGGTAMLVAAVVLMLVINAANLLVPARTRCRRDGMDLPGQIVIAAW